MISKSSLGVLASVLAFAFAAPGGAVPAAPVPTAPTGAAAGTTTVVAYVVQNHDRHVTVQDGAGKTLGTARAGTPTLQLILSLIHAVKPRPRQVSLRLQDQYGLPLWSQLLPVPPETHTFKFSAHSSSTIKGTRLELTFSTQKPDTPTPADDPDPPPFVITLDAEGQFVGMKGSDTELKRGAGDNDTILTGANGSGGNASINLKKDGSGGMMVLNGVQIPITQVRRDGKTYLSFPWNGHTVFVGDGCQFVISSNGDLTIDPPGTSK